MAPALAATLALTLALTSVMHIAHGHNVRMEAETVYLNKDGNLKIRHRPWKSWIKSHYKTPIKLEWSILTSQAIFAYLDTKDYDVYEFSMTDGPGNPEKEGENDFEQVKSFFRNPNAMPYLLAAPAPAACFESLDNFPSVALVAPLGDSTSVELQSKEEAGVPFPVPAGYGVHVVHNPKPKPGEQRVIYVNVEIEGEEPLNLSWFMPDGCFLPYPGGLDCSKSASLTADLYTTDVKYYIVVWDPTGKPQDYTMSIGLDERFVRDDLEVEGFVRNQNHLKTECTEPYPGVPW